jgi:serine/threonine protein kinase
LILSRSDRDLDLGCQLARRAKDAQSDFFPGFSEIAEIGSGDLATVYRAREAATDRYVALKLLNVRDRSPRALESFDREANTLGPISSHPNIVTLFGSFRAADGRPVLVLELCRAAVADRLVDGQGLPVCDVVSIGIKIAGALDTAHRVGILHRDVKPQNMLVTEFGEPALSDFGVALLKSSTQVTAGLFDFTTLHAAPELLEGGETSAATDVYELASSLYQLVAGRSAFRANHGESPAAVILRILRDPVEPLAGAHVPEDLSALLLRAMAKERGQRPATAAEFAAQLAAIEAAQGWPPTSCVIRDADGRRIDPAAPGDPDATWSAPSLVTHTPPADSWSAPSLVTSQHQPVDDATRQRPTTLPPAPPPHTPAPPVTDEAGSEGSVVEEPPAAVTRRRPTTLPPPTPPQRPTADVRPFDMPVPDPAAMNAQTINRPPRDEMPLPRDETAPPPSNETVLPPSNETVPSPAELTYEDLPPNSLWVPPAVGDSSPHPVPDFAQSVEMPTATGPVPTWVFRAPNASPGPGMDQPVGDLTLDPASLRHKVTIRSGATSLTIDEGRLVSRRWFSRTEIRWPSVHGFETCFDQGSGNGYLVVHTDRGPVELSATRGSSADLRYVQALLAAYRQRAMSGY